jgi:hypothetical protein
MRSSYLAPRLGDRTLSVDFDGRDLYPPMILGFRDNLRDFLNAKILVINFEHRTLNVE